MFGRLKSAGVTQVTTDGHFINFATTVGTANSLLNTTFLTYKNSGVAKIRATQYSVPNDLASHIDLISPITYFGKTVANFATFKKPSKTKRNAETATTVKPEASCTVSITPNCLKEL